jgi:hypothetical protein
MFRLDGSETSWLVYADWLEDQDLDARHIREPLFVNSWTYEANYNNGISAGTYETDVGTVSWRVGCNGDVGSKSYNGAGSCWRNDCRVGGNHGFHG